MKVSEEAQVGAPFVARLSDNLADPFRRLEVAFQQCAATLCRSRISVCRGNLPWAIFRGKAAACLNLIARHGAATSIRGKQNLLNRRGM
jgi:hypothetical protein